VLTNEGFEIDTAVNGKPALDLLKEKDYELCLIDISIVNGKQLYKVIVGEYQKLAKGVIFTTGDITDDYIRYFLEVAGRPFLTKPFTPDELKTVVRQTMRQIAR
jgi:DNA-binding response OmpR family regulator